MRTRPPTLLPLFRSEMQVELLALVLLQPDREWTLDELARLLQAPPSSVHRELRRLIDAGLVRRDARSRPHGFQAAPDSPAYPALRDLLELTAGVPTRVSQELGDMPAVLAASIHGSWAAGRVRPESDLDVIVVVEGDRDRDAVQKAVRRLGKQIGRDVDVSVLSVKNFGELARHKNPFLMKILRGPRIDVVRDLRELAAAA